MYRLVTVVAASLIVSGGLCLAQAPKEERVPPSERTRVPPASERARTCCKVCRKGKACGNSCINAAYTCHQPPGCACDAN